MEKARIGIVGASGYTGSELARILSHHPHIRLEAITSESHAGKRLSDLHPHLSGVCDLPLIKLGDLPADNLDAVFLALPHGVSMRTARQLWDSKAKIIDLSGDFRLPDAETYTKWYGMPHEAEALIDEAVYGLPELFREDIRKARLIANPGCYPTSAILALYPLLSQGLVKTEGLVVDSKSGVSGAGVKPKEATHFATVNEGFTAYGLSTHRHRPEIGTTLTQAVDKTIKVLFTPHLVPMNRGILSTSYAVAAESATQDAIEAAYLHHYGNEPFVRMRANPPRTTHVRGSNYCDIHVRLDADSGHVIVVSVIDNLVKGAAGQAVHNMNLMFDFDETTGLMQAPIAP